MAGSRFSLTEATLRAFLQHRPGYAGLRVFVETGTYLGATTVIARRVFPLVHTVEVSEALYRRAVALHHAPGIHFHLGDSRAFVARLALEIEEPAVWFLDAHWFKGTTQPVGGQDGLPLWEELRAIAARPAGDLVLLDDVHVFGGREPTPEWERVTLDTLAAALPGCQEAVIVGPHAALYR